jgi:hypothetical protein
MEFIHLVVGASDGSWIAISTLPQWQSVEQLQLDVFEDYDVIVDTGHAAIS